jgi:hypothetical protein
MRPKLRLTLAARLPHVACDRVCAELVRPARFDCARQKSSLPNPGSQENDRKVPQASLRLDRRRKAVYGADHPQGVFPCPYSPQSLARNSLHYLRKRSSALRNRRLVHCWDAPGSAHKIVLIAYRSHPSTAGSSPQNKQRLASTNRIAAIVTAWYTRSSGSLERLRSPAGAAMNSDAVGESRCIAGLPFSALRQRLRILDLAGSHHRIPRHQISSKEAEQR